MIKNILFDLDGTIIDSEEGIIKCAVYSFEKMNLPVPEYSELLKFIGPPLVDTYSKEYGLNEEDTKLAVNYFRERYQPIGVFECKLFDGVIDMLSSLKDKGYTIALTSSKKENFCHVLMKHFEIEEYFDEIVGCDEENGIIDKRDVLEEFFKRKPECKPAESILVGDTKFDALGAKGLLDCLGVSYGFDTNENLIEAGVIAIVDSPMEVVKYIESIS